MPRFASFSFESAANFGRVTLLASASAETGTTLDGLPDSLRRVWAEALVASGGSQCGFCTPGFMMTATELLRENPRPSEAQVREAISGNVCRCTGYQSIVDGILRAAELIDE